MTRWPLCLSLCLVNACIGDVDVAPPAPTLLDVTSPTTVPRQTIAGGKLRGAAVLNHGDIIVEHDDSATWSFDLPLAPGSNPISLTAQSPGGKVSRSSTEAVIVYEPPCPSPPELDPVDSPTATATQTLAGTKPPETAVELWRLDATGGVQETVEVEAFGVTTTWSYELTLSEGDGVYRYAVVAVDADDKASEPVLFEVILDTTPPSVATAFPSDGTTAVPTNTTLEVSFDEPLGIDAGSPPIAITVTAGGPVNGVVRYHQLSHTLTFTAAADLPASTTVSVSLVAAQLPDRAGNTATSFTAWSFTTGADADTGSAAMPTVTGGDSSPTTSAVAPLTGEKDAGSSIWINNIHAVPVDDQTTWSVEWPLGVGSSDLVIVSKRPNGAASAAAVVTIVRNLEKPAPPTVEPEPPVSVTESALLLTGGKEVGTALMVDGAVAVCRTPEDAWGVELSLLPGPNDIELRTRNAAGVVSDPVVVSVDYAQTYQGQVPGSHWLQLAIDLRDLSDMNIFDEGPNMYSLDVWLEGPLDAGEVCVFDAATHERQAIGSPLTLMHYQGSTATAANPFTMADYRAPDYIAALVTSGSIPGVGPTTDRRDENGRTGLALPSSAVDDIDDTCYARSSLSIDGCTEATRGAGIHAFEWPLLAPDSQRIPQGEYLLNVLINIDRQPLWVGVNDTETCWADDAFATRGPHRIARRMSLGEQAYSVSLTPLSESSGPDSDPSAEDGQLRYVGDAGVRIEWGPR